MSKFRIGRLAEDIKRELTAIIRELKDPRISEMISIIKVDLSNDYVSSFDGMEKTIESVKGLDSAAGYIKREIFARLKMRKSPDFHFIADNSIEYSTEINKILKDIEKK